MKFNLRSLADAGKRAPNPRTRWCSYCKRNEHHLCSGTRRVNHGRTVPCECPHRDRHDPNRRLALNRPPPISLRTNTAVGRSCYLVADQAHPELSKEEVGILDLLARGLSREFPNPQRLGCPSSKVLRDIAFRKLRLAEVHEWLDHLGTCSPCYREFTELLSGPHEVANGRFLVVAAVMTKQRGVGRDQRAGVADPAWPQRKCDQRGRKPGRPSGWRRGVMTRRQNMVTRQRAGVRAHHRPLRRRNPGFQWRGLSAEKNSEGDEFGKNTGMDNGSAMT